MMLGFSCGARTRSCYVAGSLIKMMLLPRPLQGFDGQRTINQIFPQSKQVAFRLRQ